MIAILALLLSLAGAARAHGTLDFIIADDVTYPGPLSMDVDPESLPANSPIRQIYTLEPMLATAAVLASANMTCGPAPAPSAPVTAPVLAGSSIALHFRSGMGGAWPHDTGPVITYMYKCPDDSSSTPCLPAPGEMGWFKIAEQGMDAHGVWAQKAMMHNASLSVVVPSGIPDGAYLLRHEVWALQNAVNRGAAELAVSCTQVRVHGGQGDLGGAEMVAFPGAYSEDDPGIYVPGLYDHDGRAWPYVFPGPAVFGATASSSAAPSSTSLSAAASATTSAHSGSSTATSQTVLSVDAAPTIPSCMRRVSTERVARPPPRLVQGRLNPRALRK